MSHVAQHRAAGSRAGVGRAHVPAYRDLLRLLELVHLLFRADRRAVLLRHLVLRADAAGDVPADPALPRRLRTSRRPNLEPKEARVVMIRHNSARYERV